MPNYNQTLQTNNSSLEEIKSKINSLPSASGGTDTSDATASANDIMLGETAYTASGKVTGTFTIEDELTEQNDLISQITTLVAQKANPQGGTDTSDATATASDILSGKTAYVNGEKVTGTILTVTQATPGIMVNTSGLITASSLQAAGYVSAGTKSSTEQLAIQAAKTITPTTIDQTAVTSGKYTTGAITVKGDANLIAGNIKGGVSIFGVVGNYESGSSSSGGSIETCTVNLGNESPMSGSEVTVYFVDETQTVKQETFPETMMDAYKTITVQKNSLVVANTYVGVRTGATIVATLASNRIVFITDNTGLYLM